MRNILFIVLLFIAAQFLGMFVGSVLSADYTENPYIQDFYFTPQGETESFVVLLGLFVLILIGTAFLLLIIKYYKGKLLFLLLEFFLISIPSSIVFYSFARLQLPYSESMILGIFLGISLAAIKIFFNLLRNASAVFASAAVGALFGLSFSPFFVLIFIVLLALYDYIAVFKTKHMVTLAKEILKKDIALTISSKVKIPKVGIKRIDLGTGDIIAPIMLEVSFLQFNPNASLLVLLGSSLAVFLIFYLSRKRKVILPALPPIVAGILIMLLFGYLAGVV